MKRSAIFFDRDNTLIINHGYLGDAAGVRLMPGAAEAVAGLRRMGFAIVIFSNQSGVARGMFDEDAVHDVNGRLDALLAAENSAAIIDRHEFCPFHPDGKVAHYRQESDLRKPKPGMIFNAAEALSLDLNASWVIGDTPRDIEAGHAAGCRTILFRPEGIPASNAATEEQRVAPDCIVGTLGEAVAHIEKIRQVPAGNRVGLTNERVSTPGVLERSVVKGLQAAAAPAKEEKAASVGAIGGGVAASRGTMGGGAVTGIATGVRAGAAGGGMLKIAEQASAGAAIKTPEPMPVAKVHHAAGEPGGGDAMAVSPVGLNYLNPSGPAVAPPEPRAIEARGQSTRLEALAEQILLELRRRNEQDVTDFSVSKLLAGVIQVIVLAVMFLAYIRRDGPSLQTILLVAVLLQTLTISLLIMSRQK